MAAAAPSPSPASGPVLLGKGVIPSGVKVNTDGPAAFSVRTAADRADVKPAC